jgi:hypothetical protein
VCFRENNIVTFGCELGRLFLSMQNEGYAQVEIAESIKLEQLSTIGETHSETITGIRPGIDEASLIRKLALEHQYRIVRHIDIAAPPKIHSKQTEMHRGSWVEALTTIDPSLVDFDEREIPERTRTLHNPRFAKYIEEHGTNQVKVRPHHRTVLCAVIPNASLR